MMNILVHIVYCQQRLVRYNMFKDILRQLLKESENIIRIFPLKGLFSHLSAQKRSRKGKYIISEKRPFQQLSSVSNIFADYFCFVLCFFVVFVFLGPYDHLHRMTRYHVPKSKL